MNSQEKVQIRYHWLPVYGYMRGIMLLLLLHGQDAIPT